ncbi:hypothetical protein ACFLUV_03595 [Elusimicrobiota bacterium]
MIRVKERYKNFVAPNFPEDPFSADISADPESKYPEKISVIEKNKYWHICGRGIDIDLMEGAGGGRIFPDVHILDSLLRIIYSYLLVKNSGFLMHAAGHKGRVYTGPAGSGKTTSVRGKKGILGDDIIALKKEEGTWHIYSTPFTGEFEGMVEYRKEKLKKFYILNIGKKKLDQGEIYKELFKNIVYFFADSKYNMDKLAEYCAELSAEVPGYGFKNK